MKYVKCMKKKTKKKKKKMILLIRDCFYNEGKEAIYKSQ